MKIQTDIERKLGDAFAPLVLDVQNESHMHSVPPGSESHFKVTIVSEKFAGLRPVKRHQQVYAVLQEELQKGVHALALHTYTSTEWQGFSPESPQCLGGSKQN